MRITITGSKGQLGQALRDVLAAQKSHDFEATFIDIDDLDLTDANAVNDYFETNPCDFLINCAAYTAVDKAESEPEKADAINRVAVKNIAENAARHGFWIIHVSTDYVFDGESNRPYTEEIEPNPKSVYGKTKLAGERALEAVSDRSIIIRTAWLYSPYGKNFYLTMRQRALNRLPVRVVCDQHGTPTSAHDLASAIIKILSSGKQEPGVYHFTDEGETTWWEFTREIYTLHGAEPELVTPITSEEYPTAAERPRYSVLDKKKIKETFKLEIPHWKESLLKLKNGTE